MIAGMTGNMMSLSWQRRGHGKRRRRNRRTTASNVHWTADIAGGGSGEKPSACLIFKKNVCNHVSTQDVHGTCGRTQIKVAESSVRKQGRSVRSFERGGERVYRVKS